MGKNRSGIVTWHKELRASRKTKPFTELPVKPIFKPSLHCKRKKILQISKEILKSRSLAAGL